MGKAVTMADIAKKLNTSTVTVSKAFTDKDGVSDEMRAKIKQLASELGYSYNTAAKSHNDSCTHNICIIIADRNVQIGMSFYWEIYKKLTYELMKLDNYAFIELIKHSDEIAPVIPKIINDNRVDGIIVLGQVHKNYFEMIKNQPIPVVFVDFYERDTTVDFVVTDNFYSMYQLTDYLIDMGHRDIGFIGNIHTTSSIQDRYLGYLKALIENNIDLDKCKQWYISDREEMGGAVNFAIPDKLPTAFVCNNDQVACKLINDLKAAGYNVPEDISVVGFDNYLISNDSDPKITTVEVDMKTMAQTSVDILIKRINNNKSKKGIRQIGGKIIINNSVKDINV